ncbi:hypothetical protein OC861_005269 [Tilletia horrida]|nr:hypothetical protein OC861_005269 [Tilletia horrida]
MLRTDQKARRLEQDFKKLQEVENLRLCMVSKWQDEWQAAVQTFRSTHGASEGTSKDVSAELDQHMTQFFGSLRQESVALGKLRRRTELTMIVTALREANLDLHHGGHYYRCSNGCGGAMQLSNCPECGVRIGGADHSLVEGNTFDDELEEIARETGAAPSPWAWGRQG